MKLPVIPHRGVNKIICLVFTGMTIAFLLIGGIYALSGDPDMGLLFCFPAAISAVFSLLYGILWFAFHLKNRKHQKKLEYAAQILGKSGDSIFTYENFCLPKEELVHASKHRFQTITAALLISGVSVFAVLYGILFFVNDYGGVGHLILVMSFCLLMVVPGILIQYNIFRKYARSVPETILLYPGQIIVDDLQYETHNIEKITVSSIQSASKDTSVLYRKLIIHTHGQAKEYTIDYRFADKDTPHWKDYSRFLGAIRSWAEQYRVNLTVDYMN